MALYHAGRHNQPLCGTRGTGNRYNVICVDAKRWNELKSEHKCSKCVAKIKEKKHGA